MMQLFLRCSDLSRITRHNKFKPIEEYLEELLSRNKIIKKYIPKSNTERKLIECSEDKLSSIKQELNLKKSATLEDIEAKLKIITSSSLINKTEQGSKTDLLKGIHDKPIIKELLKNSIEQDIRMKRGNIKEDSALNKTQKKLDINIGERNVDMYSKELFKTDKCCVIIRGKVDGISKDKKVVETKNRRDRLFNRVPDYEKVQMESYMYLTGFKECIHIENYNDQQNIEEYKHNEEFWLDCVERIREFVVNNVDIQL